MRLLAASRVKYCNAQNPSLRSCYIPMSVFILNRALSPSFSASHLYNRTLIGKPTVFISCEGVVQYNIYFSWEGWHQLSLRRFNENPSSHISDASSYRSWCCYTNEYEKEGLPGAWPKCYKAATSLGEKFFPWASKSFRFWCYAFEHLSIKRVLPKFP